MGERGIFSKSDTLQAVHRIQLSIFSRLKKGYSMRAILVTGGAGNIGGSLVRRLVEDPENFVVSADNLVTGSVDKLPSLQSPNWKFIKCDCNNYKELSSVMLAYP